MRFTPLTLLMIICLATLSLSVYLHQRLTWLRYKEKNLIQKYNFEKRRYFTLYHSYMHAIAPHVIAAQVKKREPLSHAAEVQTELATRQYYEHS